VLAGFFLPLRHLKSAELNKIAAFIAAFFIARLIGRVPFGLIPIKLEGSC
jgi:hypothetical protein